MHILGGALLGISILLFCVFVGQLSSLVFAMRRWEAEWQENEWTHAEAIKNAPINLMAVPKDLTEIYKYFWIWVIVATAGLILFL